MVDSVITNNGTININSNTIQLSNTGGGKRLFTNKGQLNINSGSLLINGYAKMQSGSVYYQTGGLMQIDGNAAGVSASSAPSMLLRFDTCTINATGGSIVFVDPHVSGSQVLYDAGVITGGFSGTHTMTFGDGISGLGGTTNGFYVQTKIPLNNVLVNGSGFSSNRRVLLANNVKINGNLTLQDAGAEFADGANVVYLAGNMFADSYTKFTLTGELDFVNSSSPQTVSGTGTYRNSTSVTPGANFTETHTS